MPGRHSGRGPPVARFSGSHPRLHLPFWPLACGGFPERVCPLGKREARTPCPLAEGNVGQVLDRTEHRATSRCLAVAILSWVRNRGGGAPAGSPPCPRAPRWLEVRFSPRAGACQTKRLANGVPRGHASQPFYSLRSRPPSVAFAETESRKGLLGRCGCDPSFVSRYPKRWRDCAVLTWGTRAPPAARPLNSRYPGRDCLVHETRMH